MNQQQKDIIEERQKASFSTRDLTCLLNGGIEQTEKIEKIRNLVEKDPVFDRADEYFLTPPQKYRRGLERLKRVRELVHNGTVSHFTEAEMDRFQDFAFGGGLQAMSLHEVMFLPTIRGQADDEQLARWLKPAENYDIIGCYAQTELGHGSNVRGLETTATFDPATDEIIIHSPTLTSTKWWPGALGKSATHAIVHAHLLLPKTTCEPGQSPEECEGHEDKGIHAFMVQLRDVKTFKLLPGIQTGMIGPKYGIPMNDNGYARFNQVRIPRKDMLSKFTKLERDGRYHVANAKASQLSYGTMLLIRSGIVEGAGMALSLASTIVTRYSSVRRQFPPANQEEAGDKKKKSGMALEQRVLDFQAQQYRIFPHLATSYALLATGRYMKNLFENLQEGLKNNDLGPLPEAHATSSGLKAVTTILASAGIEECRKACGGHGYLLNSGLCDLFTGYVCNNTLEGENYLIIQQLSRYLIKTFKGVQVGQIPVGNAKYLTTIAEGNFLPMNIEKPEDLRNPQNQLASFANRAGFLIAQTVERMDELVNEGSDFTSAFQAVQWLAIKAARAHCMYTILVSFVDFVEHSRNSKNRSYQNPNSTTEIPKVLKTLCDLFAMYYTENELGEFMEAKLFSTQQCGWIHQQVEALLREVRPNAVGLVDAFNHTDRDLNSALGRYDGNVYEALFDWTKKDPMNQKEVVECFDDVIKPMLTKNFTPSKL